MRNQVIPGALNLCVVTTKFNPVSIDENPRMKAAVTAGTFRDQPIHPSTTSHSGAVNMKPKVDSTMAAVASASSVS